MSRTALLCVNDVLTNLRQSNVTDFSANYTLLLLSLVNKAKEKVEDYWRWRCLTSEISFVTVAGQQLYYVDAAANAPAVTLTLGSNYPDPDRSYILQDSEGKWQGFDLTEVAAGNLYQLQKVARENIQSAIYLGTSVSNQIPYYFAFGNEVGRPAIYLASPPFGSRTLKFRLSTPTPLLAATTDTVLVPYRPVVSFATAWAMQERGEELGMSADTWIATANEELLRASDKDAEGNSYTHLTNPDA